MSINKINVYDLDPHIAEIYDQSQTDRADVDLLLSLIGSIERNLSGSSPLANAPRLASLTILEPFCGTGRILIPLVKGGHRLTGLDQSVSMLGRLRQKLAALPEEVQDQVTLGQMDVVTADWPVGFDLVVLGGNCLYELATPGEQAHLIQSAAVALKPGGYLYVDNDHMEGELSPSWQRPGISASFPSGNCADGTRVESTIETIWFDAPARLARFHRTTVLRRPASAAGPGETVTAEAIQQKHPVSALEVQGWLENYGFVIERLFGDHSGNDYTPTSPRATFWARRIRKTHGTPH